MLKALRWISSAIAGYIVQGWVALGMTLLTGVLGWIGEFPAFYLYLSMVGVAAASMSLLARHAEWRERTHPEHKLAFARGRFSIGVNQRGSAKAHLGFELVNLAPFPIEFHVAEMSTRIGNTVPARLSDPPQPIELSGHGQGWFEDEAIDWPDLLAGESVEGFLSATLRYGLPGKPAHELRFEKRVTFAMTTEGRIVSSAWYDHDLVRDEQRRSARER